MSPDPRIREQIQPRDGVWCVGGVNVQGKPFVHIHVDGKPYGQLDPGEAMMLGIRFIQAGIEAERDSSVVRAANEMEENVGEAQGTASAMLTMIRSYRDQWDPDVRQQIVWKPLTEEDE